MTKQEVSRIALSATTTVILLLTFLMLWKGPANKPVANTSRTSAPAGSQLVKLGPENIYNFSLETNLGVAKIGIQGIIIKGDQIVAMIYNDGSQNRLTTSPFIAVDC